ncbi:replicative DNA helicase [Romboutsia lituseburensis]|uniref:DNA 5'-3' helicase n=1 Tax=Romboutsia lituseburensis DSM 797 TaxID=1121325 RepID=A0A1G9PJH4_9FIRM|nr:DnaB-like helicase C-terminal domain-containing protein [Romboutsia lituseburensis]CEH33414.1 Replicative DNA helicase [Romboutsia lituseburensis]SDL98879.1 Replicative DNA helicase [Romboutsia lituseburensis DSM 797]
MKNFDAVNIEQSILGTFIVDESLGYKLEELSRDLFTFDYNKEIFSIMLDLYKSNMSLDIQTISTKLSENNLEVNISYLSNLAVMSQSFAIDTHIEILKDKYLRREIIKNCTSLFQSLGDGDEINSVIYNFENRMQKILNKEKVKYNDSICDICEGLLNFLESDEEIGMRFGVKFLDDVIGGLFNGELTTIAARSGVGKTALALQIMLNCMEQKKKVLFVSREMTSQQVFMRNLTKRTGISTKNMKNKDLDEDSWKSIIKVMGDFSQRNLIYINDKISTISELRKRIRVLNPDLVIVDYVQLMSVESSLQNREREVATLSRELKNITLDFDIPVIQLSQLNDEMKDFRPWGERPMRDSKAIFHDSNNVIYIHEPVLSEFDEACDDIKRDKRSVLNAKKKGIKLVDLIVAKCRDGEIGFRHYCYKGSRLHFQYIEY